MICAATVEFLGHNVSEHGLLPNEAKVAAIRTLQPPTIVSQLRSVLSFIGCYRCYIPNYSAMAFPLNQLLGKNVEFDWGEKQQLAFDALKSEVCTEGRVLRHQDPNKPLILHTDWSNVGIGAVSGQVDDQGNEYMIACINRSLNVHERNYSSPQGEMLAAVWAVKTFHTYLHGEDFTLVTDHQPLTFLMSKPDLVALHARWAITLQQYTFTIVHKPGIQHQIADCLSRLPSSSVQDTTGARLHDEEATTTSRSALTLQMCAMQAVLLNQEMQQIYDLSDVAQFSSTFCPTDMDMVTQFWDASESFPHSYSSYHTITQPYVPTLLHTNMRVDVGVCSKGVVPPCLTASFFAANTLLCSPAKQNKLTSKRSTVDHQMCGRMSASFNTLKREVHRQESCLFLS